MATMNVAATTYLVTLRKRQGMSRAKLADLIGLSVMSIGRVEKGDRRRRAVRGQALAAGGGERTDVVRSECSTRLRNPQECASIRRWMEAPILR